MCSYLIIEKDRGAITSIKNVLGDFHDFNCVAITDNESSAMNTILKETPKLVFLNIDNAIDQPFNFVNEINLYSKDSPIFIAISNSRDSAYDVIKGGFFDLLLNPLSDLDIRKSILIYQKKNPTKNKKSICLKSYQDFQYLKTNEILFLKADNNTTDFYMSDGNIISAYKTLKTYEGLLPDQFLRIHKSYIINKDYVSRIQFGKYTCTLKNSNHNIPFTKTYIDNIQCLKNNLSQYSYQYLN